MTDQPTTEVAVHEPSGGALSERMRYAQALATASLLPRAYQRQPGNVLLAMEYGAALGLAPMVAIQSIHVVDGKPTASAQLIGALVRRHGHRLRVTGDATRASAEIIRADDPDFVFRSEWTLDRAKAAGLLGKGVWKQYPDAMLKARAITEVARDACPEVLAGVAYTAEELGHDGADDPSWTGTDAGADAPTNVGSADAGAAPASPDIDDAVIVEQAGEAEARGEASPASPARHPETEARFKRMQILLRERFGTDREAVYAWVGQQVGREVASTADLDGREIAHVIAVLEGVKAEAVA